jgi:hypothetical protein
MEHYGRVDLACSIFACLIQRLAELRGYLPSFQNDDLYYYGDDLTRYVWWSAVFVILNDTILPPTKKRSERSKNLVNVLTTLCICILGLFIVWDTFIIAYLVHVACRSIDGTLVFTGNRYPVLTFHDEASFALLALIAVTSALCGSAFIIRQVAYAPAKRGMRQVELVSAIGLLLPAVTICWWHYSNLLPRVSPDLADADFAASRPQQLTGLVLGGLAAAYAAYRVSRAAAANRRDITTMLTMPLRASLAATLLLIAASIVYWVQVMRFSLQSWYGSWFMDLMSLFQYPDTYFVLAISVLSVKAARLQLKGQLPLQMEIVPTEPRTFWVGFASFILIIAVGIPAFAVAGFLFWLGPWYRW